MQIHSVRGNIFEVAPNCAEACALWLRGGYCMRGTTWSLSMRPAYAERLQLHEPPMVHGLIDHPWLAENDTLFHLDPPDGNLQWLYVFANPDDAHGYENLDEVGQAVVRCLDRLAEENVGSVAFLHIPLSRDGNFPTAENNDESALALVEALRAWDEGNPERITDVLLVDLSGDFDRVLH